MIAAAFLALLILALPEGLPFYPVLGGLWLLARKEVALPSLPRLVWALLILLGLMLVLATSLKGQIQFLACLGAVPVFARLGERGAWRALAAIPVVFSAATLAILLLAMLLPGSGLFNSFFMADEYGGERFRFVFSEPNHFVAFLFFLLILTSRVAEDFPVPVRLLTVAGALAAAAAAASPLGYLGILAYFWSLASRQPWTVRAVVLLLLALFALLALQFLPDNVQARIGFILDGQDNSINFRTWGSMAIAATSLIDAGTILQGVGLGGSRAVLDGNPYMIFFAASDESVLPSFAATTLLEIGAIGLGLVLTLWGVLLWHSRHMPPAFHAMAFMVANCLTGSFLFDSSVWSAFGLVAGIAAWQRRTASAGPPPPPPLPPPLPLLPAAGA